MEPPPQEHSQTKSKEPEDGIGICLSGGGYRAMLYHVGALWRLNEIGLLTRAARISSVSGGSITAAWLARVWAAQNWPAGGAIPGGDFEVTFAQNICRVADHTIDAPSILCGLFTDSIGEEVADRYDRLLFDGATLQDLPDHPRFVINASNLQTGRLWRFSKPYMDDYTVGRIVEPKLRLASAVAASSAFPPFLSPVRLKLRESDYTLWPENPKPPNHRPPFTTSPVLADGGVYDNLGLEPVFKRYKTVLVSNGGAAFKSIGRPRTSWPFQAYRVLHCIDDQVRSQRVRHLIDSYETRHRTGCYWGIATSPTRYRSSPLVCNPDTVAKLAALPTRLRAISRALQRSLINWGYASCAASLETNFPQPGPSAQWPYPDQKLT